MAVEVFIVNASPLITLAKAGHLHLLDLLEGTLLIPQRVVEEIHAGPHGDPARVALEEGFGRIEPASDVPFELAEWGLGAGETAVIALALAQPGSTVILDDAAARTCARAHNIPMMGTLAVVLRARRRGVIASAASVLRSLRASGLHLDDATIAEALRTGIGEDWGTDG